MTISSTSENLAAPLWHHRFSWLMIFLLSLFPALILHLDWNPEGELEYLQKQFSEAWYKGNDTLAERFFQATSHDFWCREYATGFQKMTSALMVKGFAPEAAMRKTFSLLKNHMETAPLMFFFYPDRHGAWAASASEGRGSVYILRQLFAQMTVHYELGVSELSGNTWEQRIKSIFGRMSFSEMFLPDYRLKPVPVFYQGRYYYLAWDYIVSESGKKIEAGFFHLMPVEFSRSNEISGRIIRHWNLVDDQYVQGNRCWPVMFDFMATGSQSVILHPEIADPEFFQAAYGFFTRNFFTGKNSLQENELEIPSEMTGKPLMIGDKIARICYSDPVSGIAGLIVADPPTIPQTIRQVVAGWYLGIAGVVWCLFFIKAMIFRRLPAITIRLRVLLWFLAFAAFPAGLSMGSLTATMQELRDLKISAIHRDLHQLVLHVEAEMARFSEIFLHSSLRTFQDPDLVTKVISLPGNPEKDGEVFTQLRQGYLQNGIEPAAMVLVTQGGWCFSSFAPTCSPRYRKSSRDLFGAVIDKFLKQADPAFYEKMLPESSGAWLDKRVSVLAVATDFKVYKNFGAVRDRFNNVSEIWIGNDFALQFLSQINHGDKIFAVMVVLWKPDQLYQSALRRCLAEEAVNYRKNSGSSPDIAVFKSQSGNARLLQATGRIRGFEKITRVPSERAAYLYDHDHASIVVPSQRMPGYVIAARVTVDQIELQLFFEQFSMLSSLALLLVIILVGALIASVWIGRPLQDFIPDLASIRNGRPLLHKLEGREDEISATARSIRRMSDWLQEREKIKKFVAPQAINAILDGNFIKAGAGTMRKVIILVSDIRSFTSLSEENNPEEVFDMVNNHLSSMARVIEEWGGVIDRFVGDAVWAIFYEDVENQAKKAMNAALEMKRVHLGIQEERAARGMFTIRIGIGLVRGQVLAGVMGNSGVRLDYTVVGKALQDAEDAESASKNCRHTGIVFGESLAADLEKISRTGVPGFDNLYEVVSLDQTPD